MGTEAVELNRQMPNDLIDKVTHLCILNACSHAGLVDDIQKKSESITGAMVRTKISSRSSYHSYGSNRFRSIVFVVHHPSTTHKH